MKFLAFLLMATSASGNVAKVAKVLERETAKLTPPLRQAFRLAGAASLRESYPKLAHRFIELTVTEGQQTGLDLGTMSKLAELAPDESIGLLPYLKTGSDGPLVNDLIYWRHTGAALKLYQAMLSRGNLAIFQANGLLTQLAKESPSEAVKLFAGILATFRFDPLDPREAWALLNCAGTMAKLAPVAAADACERLARAAAAPNYGNDWPADIIYGFAIGSRDISTTNSREAVLMIAGARLRAMAPDRFEKLQSLFAPWDVTGPLIVKSTHKTASPVAVSDSDPRATALDQRMKELSGELTEAQRSVLATEIARGIRALPAGVSKNNLARSLANLSTEGDLGHTALTVIGEALAQSLHETPSAVDDPYVELATLLRYEHLTVPNLDPPVRAADALLALRDSVHAHTGFALMALDGKQYSLKALRGKVVLLNFWATWCIPCRKEMPDMQRLYQAFEKRGLVVLAVSDEEPETVAGFMAKQSYTFPIALDPDKKAHSAFAVVGIPKSFIFDRKGRLVAQAMDMRTERQFRELLKRAGLE